MNLLLLLSLFAQQADALTEVQNEAELQNHFKRSQVVLFFSSPDCTFCPQMEEVVTTSEASYPNLTFAKVNNSIYKKNPEVQKLKVRVLPTTYLLKNGQVVDKQEGTIPASLLNQKISSAFGASASKAQVATCSSAPQVSKSHRRGLRR